MKYAKYEVGAVLILMMLAIWLSEIYRPLAVVLGIVSIAVILWSWLKNDTGKTIGLCPEKIGPPKILIGFFLLLASTFVFLLTIGYFVDSENFTDKNNWKKWENLAFGKYFLWGVIQQVLMHGFFTNRLANIFKDNLKTAWVIGAMFAVIHFPNWILAIGTLFWGIASAYFFLSCSRNIYLLGFAHGILATTVKYFIASPIIGHGCMRVGPGFWN